jgi:hypothetical protein
MMMGGESEIYVEPWRLTPNIHRNVYAATTNKAGKLPKLWLIITRTLQPNQDQDRPAVATFWELKCD